MTSIFQIDAHNDVWRMLPGGVYILQQHHYSARERRGVMAVALASIISILAIVGLLFAISVSLFQSWSNKNNPQRITRHAFIKSHAGIYFICMNITTLVFTIGWMLSIMWAVEGKITFGTSCTVQAALKQFGNVSTALWVLAIAVHTFVVVFLQFRVPNWVFVVMMGLVWLLSGAITAVGPLFYSTEALGPWYGISAQWCWTSDSYVTPRFTTEYFWMFLAAGASFVLYSLLFLKLRGHFSPTFRFSFKRRYMGSKDCSRVAHQMLWYPVVYTILVFPIVGCRIYEFKTFMQANLDLKMASAVLFMLTGLVNVVLYTVTRNIFPSLRKIFKMGPPPNDFYRVESAESSPSQPIFTEVKVPPIPGEPPRTSSLPRDAPRTSSSSSSSNSELGGLEGRVEIASPVQSYQPVGKMSSGSLSKSSSLSSNRPVSPSKITSNGKTRAVIRKPQPAAMAESTLRMSMESAGSSEKRGEVQRTLSV